MIARSIIDLKLALRGLSTGDRFATVFWCLGPFVLLIERSPADVWLSVLGLSFLIRAAWLRDFSWLTHRWVQLVFLFWIWCLFSAVMSKAPSYSLGEAAAWIRFPLFAMASAFWLGKDRRLLKIMILSAALGVLVMCGILAAELIIRGYSPERLSWPYGDVVPGAYLAKAGLPIVVWLVAVTITITKTSPERWLAFSLVLLIMVMTMMTGERVSFLLVVCSSFLVILTWRPNAQHFVSFAIIVVLGISAVFVFLPDTWERFTTNFLLQIPVSMKSDYYRAAVPGLIAFTTKPLIGIGPGNFRILCPEIIVSYPEFDCLNHPHQFVVQLLGEVGLIGVCAGLFFIGAMIWKCFTAGRRHFNDMFVATIWVVPFAYFWPITGNPDFFGQWHNIFMWSGMGLVMATVHGADT